MAGKLNFLTAGTNLPLADGNVKTSKMVLIEKIEEYEKFKDLFSMDLEVLERIKVSLKDKGSGAARNYSGKWYFEERSIKQKKPTVSPHISIVATKKEIKNHFSF